MRGQDIYNSQYEATTSPSSSESEEAKGEESSEEIYPQEEGQPLRTSPAQVSYMDFIIIFLWSP